MKKIAIVLVVLLASAEAWGVDADASGRSSLAGLGPIHVLVENIDKELEKGGLKKESVLADTEIQLLRSNIGIATEEESFRLPGSPYLYIQITGLRSENKSGLPTGYAATVQASLKQTVQLARNEALVNGATTWTKSATVLSPDVEAVKKNLREIIDLFTEDYKNANQKKKAKTKSTKKLNAKAAKPKLN